MHAVGKEVVVLLGIANSPCTEGLIINSKCLRYEILKKIVCLSEIDKLARLRCSFRVSAYTRGHLQGPNLRIIFVYKFVFVHTHLIKSNCFRKEHTYLALFRQHGAAIGRDLCPAKTSLAASGFSSDGQHNRLETNWILLHIVV